MTYSKESTIIISVIFFSIIIISAIILARYKQEDEEQITLKLIGYILLSAFRLSINSIPLPVGFIATCLRMNDLAG